MIATTQDIRHSWTAAEILRITVDAPEKLFSGDLATAKREFYALSRLWHPDHNPQRDALQVFQHIARLYAQAQECLKNNTWRGAGVLTVNATRAGMSYPRQFAYHKVRPFELGEMYLAETAVIYAVRREFADLFENARRHLAGFRYADDAMQAETARYLPAVPEYCATPERLVMVVPKSPEMILLADLQEFAGGALAMRHVAWMQSGLHNLACYLNYAGLVHHDLGPETYFVAPKLHYGQLLGGWWYAQEKGAKLQALPQRTLQHAPADVIREKRADARVDWELIRLTGRELLGDASGAHLAANPDVPGPIAQWLNGATSGGAVSDYRLWKSVLREAYGKPRFHALDIDAAMVYGKRF